MSEREKEGKKLHFHTKKTFWVIEITQTHSETQANLLPYDLNY